MSKKDLDFKFNVGDKVKDIITSFEGVVVGRTQWLNNCNTYQVKCQKLHNGVPQESIGFDEPQLVLIQEKIHEEHRDTGGPEIKISTTNKL